MDRVTADELDKFAHTIEGEELTTAARRKVFTVRAVDGVTEYTPASSSIPRRANYDKLVLVCDEFSRTKSFKPSDYHHLTFHSSYTLALIERYLRSRGLED